MLRTIRNWMPQIALLPSLILVTVTVYGFIAFTILLSFTGSRMFPRFSQWVGFEQYARVWDHPRWEVAMFNFAVFGALYILLTLAIGVALAIFLDQKIRAEGVLRTIYLYPMALSFIVTGVAWQWIMSPDLGLERAMRIWGWESFRFDWIKDNDLAIYCVVIAGVWQASGFVMALFLAGLRGSNTWGIHASVRNRLNSPPLNGQAKLSREQKNKRSTPWTLQPGEVILKVKLL